jgi:hypothetical protein
VPHELEELRELNGGYREEYYPGEKIDEIQRKTDMARLISHNMLDTATLVGILCYLCSPYAKKKNAPV